MKALLFFAAISSQIFAADFNHKVFENELQALAKESRDEAARCDLDYKGAEKGLDKTKETPEGEVYFADVKTAMHAAGVLQSYPGLPPSTGKLLAKIQKEIPKGAKVDLSSLFAVGDCHTIGYFGISKKLAWSTKMLKLSDADRAKVRSAELSYFRKDLDRPLSLLQLLVKADAVRVASGTGLVPLDDKQKAALSEIRGTGEKLRDALRLEQTPTPKGIRTEMDGSDKLRGQLSALLATIK